MKGLRTWLDTRSRTRARETLARRLRQMAATAGPDLRGEVEEWAAAGRDRPALIGADETLSFRDLYERANRWARWAIVEGIVEGEAVVLLFPTRPERTAAWIGLATVGVVGTLLDPALGDRAVAAAVAAIRPRHMVVEATCLPLFEAAAEHLAHACTVWVHGPHPMAYRRIDEALAGFAAVRLTGRDRRPLAPAGAAVALVARGPDGRSRVAHLDHHRVAVLATTLFEVFSVSRDDRLAVAETALGLESLLAPMIGLAAGAPCRLIDATRDPTPPSDATLLHRDDPRAEIATSPDLRLIVTATDTPPAATPVAATTSEGPERRVWSLRRDGDAVWLRLDDDDLLLPPVAGEMRS